MQQIKQQNLHRTWREELLLIEYCMELRQGICWNFHANLHTQIPQIFLHPAQNNTYYSPHKYTVTVYKESTQYAKVLDNTPPLDEKVTKYIQSKFWSLL